MNAQPITITLTIEDMARLAILDSDQERWDFIRRIIARGLPADLPYAPVEF